MIISKDFNKLWDPDNLPERIREGNFSLRDNEKNILKNRVESFYNEAEEKEAIKSYDCAVFIEFLSTLWETDDKELRAIVDHAMLLNSKLRNKLKKN